MKILSKPFLFWCGIAVLNFIVYLPGFALGARGDTLAYLTASSSLDSFPDLLTFYLNREMTEPFLFRPLLHTLLAIETWLFRLNFFYWQLFSFLLHLLVIWKLVKILFKISSSYSRHIWAALFSVLTISAEMVTWPQISGYLIFIFCFLQAFDALIDSLEGTEQTLKITFWLLLGALFYEFSIICAVVFFFTLRSVQKEKKISKPQAWLILLPLILILPLFFLKKPGPMILAPLNLAKWEHISAQMPAGIIYAFLPTMLAFQPNVGRTYLNGFKFPEFDIFFYVNILTIFSLALYTVYWIKQPKKPSLPKNQRLSQTCGFLLILQAGLIISRAALHPSDIYIQLSLYHYYFTLLLFFLWISISIPSYASAQPRWLCRIPMIIISLLIIVNAVCTYRIYRALANRMTPWVNFIASTDRFIKLHKTQRNFSFQIIYTECNISVPITDINDKHFNLPEFELLFKPYLSQHPTYYLVYFQSTGLKVFATQDEASQFTAQTLLKVKKS